MVSILFYCVKLKFQFIFAKILIKYYQSEDIIIPNILFF